MRNRSMLALAFVCMLVPALTALASTSQKSRDARARSSGGIETVRSGNDVFQVDHTGKGAVLCTWGIYETIRAVGRECHKGQDAATQDELDRSIERIDNFIIKNSKHHVTKTELEAQRTEGLQQLRSTGDICTGNAEEMYQLLRTRGGSSLHAQTTDLLSIPREPVMNPCL